MTETEMRAVDLWGSLERQGELNGPVDGVDPETGFRMVGHYAAGRRVGEWQLINRQTGEIMRIKYKKAQSPIEKLLDGIVRVFGTFLGVGGSIASEWLRSFVRHHPIIFVATMIAVAAVTGDLVMKKLTKPTKTSSLQVRGK